MFIECILRQGWQERINWNYDNLESERKQPHRVRAQISGEGSWLAGAVGGEGRQDVVGSAFNKLIINIIINFIGTF